MIESKPIAAEDSSVASAALDQHHRLGASVTNPRTGELMSSARKWSVPLVPEAGEVFDRAPTAEQFTNFAATHRDLFSKHPNAQIGTWIDPQTDLHHLDIVGTTSSKNSAMNAANLLGEKGIFRIDRNEFVPSQNSGNRPVGAPSIDDRFNALRTAEPPSETFSGIHYSHTKLDFIDGGRRGSPSPNGKLPPAGAESARVRAGDAIGDSSLNAPPGFYVYPEGSLPDPSIALRKHSSRVQGKLSFANITTEPAWANAIQEGTQTALAKGAKPDIASALALNHAENTLRDAGFDGYYNPNHPNTRFIFDSHEATPLGAKPTTEPTPIAKIGAAQKLAADQNLTADAKQAADVVQKSTVSTEPGQPEKTGQNASSAASLPSDPSDPAGLLEAGEKHRNAFLS
jgi:hypothetical protein